jgi:hypothetical protein
MDKKVNTIQNNNNTDSGFNKASDDYLREALKRTYTERFLYATMLYKVQKLCKKLLLFIKKCPISVWSIKQNLAVSKYTYIFVL